MVLCKKKQQISNSKDSNSNMITKIKDKLKIWTEYGKGTISGYQTTDNSRLTEIQKDNNSKSVSESNL